MNPVKHVFLKEVREMLRDKRTRSAAFMGPIFTMILVVCGFGTVLKDIGKPEAYTYHYVGPTSEIVERLKTTGMKFTEVKSVDEGQKLIKDGKAKVVLQFSPKPTDSAGQLVITAYFDPKNQKASIALSLFKKSVEEASKKLLSLYLANHNIPEAVAEPIKVVEKEVKIGEKGASEFIVSMLPYLIVMWAFYGGFAMASDLVAGEKEKVTLETLLITPAKRTQIVLGKFFALSALCLASALSSVLGLVLISLLHLPGSSFMLKDGLGISPMAAMVIISVLLPTVAMFAALLLSFSTYAKNPREAQSYISLASFVVVIPAAFSQLIGLTDAASQGWVNFVPVLNAANNIRNALLGKPDWTGTLITVAIGALIAAVLIKMVITLFNREEVLTRV